MLICNLTALIPSGPKCHLSSHGHKGQLHLPSCNRSPHDEALSRPRQAGHAVAGHARRAVWGWLIMLLLLVLPWGVAYGAPASDPLLHLSIADIVALYQRELISLHTEITMLASRLLYGLTLISVIFTGINLIFSRSGNFQLFFLYMVKLLLTIGIFQFLIIHGFQIASDIINSITALAYHGPDDPGYVSIMGILKDFFLLANEFAESLSTRNILFFCFFMIPFFIIIVILIVNFIVNYITAFLISSIGVLVVGFGAFGITRGLAINFLHLVLALGLRLFTLCFIFRAGQNVIDTMIAHMRRIIQAGEMITIQDAGMVLFVMGLILAMSLYLPAKAAALARPSASHGSSLMSQLNKVRGAH